MLLLFIKKRRNALELTVQRKHSAHSRRAATGKEGR